MLRTLFRHQYLTVRLLGVREATVEQYEVAIHHWSRFSPEVIPLDSIDESTLCRFAKSMLTTRQPATVNKTMRHLVAVLRFAEDRGLIAKLPRWKRLREPRRIPVAFTVEEFGRVLRAVEKITGWVGQFPARLWWKSLLLSIWYSGARIGAMLAVRRDDVLVDNPGFYVRADAQKDHEDQFFGVDRETQSSWKAIWWPDRDSMWPWPYTDGCLTRRFHRIVEEAGVSTPRSPGNLFHRIRRSTASYLKAAGADATAQLGHSTPTVTQRYFDPRIVTRVNAAAFIPRPAI